MAKYVYVWIPWGCYIPEYAFSGMSQAGRTLGIKGKHIIEHFERKGYYNNDQGTLVKIDIVSNEARKGIEKNFNK